MSTIKCDNLQNTAGTKTVPVSTVVDGSAKAWVNFNGTGTVAIRSSFNVSSISDTGTGSYNVNFATPMPDRNYVISGIAGGNNAGYNNICFGPGSNGAYDTGSVELFATVGGNTSKADVLYASVVIFR